MSTYAISFGYTFTVEADSEESAIEQAEQMCVDEWGKEFYRSAWMSDAEVVGQ